MKLLQTFALLLFLAITSAAADVPFVAHLANFSSAPANAYLLVSLDASTCPASQIPRTSAKIISTDKQKLTPDGTGLVSSTLTPRQDITCGAVSGTTQYVIEVWEVRAGQPDRKIRSGCYQVNSTDNPFTLELAAPQTCPATVAAAPAPVLKNPNVSQTVVQPAGTSLAVQGGTVDLSSSNLKAPQGVSGQAVCSASTRGQFWVIQGGTGVADLLQVCLKNAADAYVWVTK